MTVIIWSWKPNKPRKHTNPHLHAHYNLLLWFSCSVVSNSLRPHGLQHARLPCLSLSPGVYSNSIVAFSSCPQSFPAWGSFPVSQLFTPGVQTIGSLVSASVLPMNIQGWFPLGLTGLISLQSKGLSGVFSNTTVQKHQFFSAQLSLWSNSQSIHDYQKTIALTKWTFVGRVVSRFLFFLIEG